MKRLLFILLLTIPFVVFGQLNLLDKKNGFKNIKLGTNVLKYEFIKKYPYDKKISFGGNMISVGGRGQEWMDLDGFTYKKIKECDLWTVDTENTELHTFPNNNKIKRIFITTYNNLILSIQLYIDDNISRNIPETLITVFGSPTNDDLCKNGYSFKERIELCTLYWTTNKIELIVSSKHNHDYSKQPYYQERIGWVITYSDIKLNSIIDDIHIKEKHKEIKRSEQELKDQF